MELRNTISQGVPQPVRRSSFEIDTLNELKEKVRELLKRNPVEINCIARKPIAFIISFILAGDYTRVISTCEAPDVDTIPDDFIKTRIKQLHAYALLMRNQQGDIERCKSLCERVLATARNENQIEFQELTKIIEHYTTRKAMSIDRLID